MPEALERIGVHLPSLVAYVVNFLLLLGVLYLIAYRPFLRMLRERRERIQQGLEQTEAAKQVLAEADEQRERVLRGAGREAAALVESARRQAQEELAESRRRGMDEAAAYLSRARLTRDAEEGAARARLQAELAELAVLAAERVLGRMLDRQAHADLVAEAVRELLAMAPDERTRRSALYARVTSAVPLTPDEAVAIARAAARLAGWELPIVNRVDPELLGGVTLAVGDRVVDASLRGRLHLLHRRLTEELSS